jgi:small GTP-binding protein
MSRTFSRISASGAAALQVWRLRAEIDALRALLGLNAQQSCLLDRPRFVRIAAVQDGELLDEALLCAKSATEYELCLHGGLGVARAWRAHLEASGWTEEVQAKNDCIAFIQACSPLQARLAWRAQAAEAAQLSLDQLRPWADWARAARGEARVVIAGTTNAGKSSLMNAWLRQERVTVSPHPGTTRDAVEAGILVGEGAHAFELQLIDTAGFWATASGSDARAVEQSHAAIQAAWMVVWLVDQSQPVDAELMAALSRAKPHDLLLLSRADRSAATSLNGLREAFPGCDLGAFDLRVQADAAAQACVQAILKYLGSPPPIELALPLSAEAWQELDAERSARG